MNNPELVADIITSLFLKLAVYGIGTAVIVWACAMILPIIWRELR